MMKKSAGIVIIIFLLFIIIGFIFFNILNNSEKIIVCENVNDYVEMKFKNNKILYVKGTKTITEEDFNIESIESYNNLINYNKEKGKLNYSIKYVVENEIPLQILGFNYNNSHKYKDIIKNMENNNYYCK